MTGLVLVLDLRRDTVAGLDLPLIKPHSHPVRLQPVRHLANGIFVLAAVAEEDVVFKLLTRAKSHH